MKEWDAFKTWRGSPTASPSEADCAAACLANAEESARLEANLERMRNELPIGDPRITGDGETSSIAYRIFLAKSDQRHWRALAQWYREGAKTIPPIPGKPEDDLDF